MYRIHPTIKAVGFLRGDIVKLRAENIDTERKLIYVKAAKGRKDRYTLLSDVARDSLIRPSDEINKYTITAKGVWTIERGKQKIAEDSLIDYLDTKFFDVYLGNKTLTDKEKVIILSMVSARSFSENSPIDLKKDEYALDAWKRIIDKSYNKLHEMKLVEKMNNDQLYGKKGNEHIVSNLIRHTDSLPKKTKGLYKAAGQQKYYRNLYSDKKLSKEALGFIISMVFGSKKNIQIGNLDEINEFCLEIAYEEAPYVYDIENHIFALPKYDDVIRNAIREALL